MQQAIAPGTVIDKRYQIQKNIPDNTSNRCYLAEDTDQSNRLVVLSFPRMELLSLPGFTTAFEDACQRLMKARLNGLVKILDHGEYDSQPYAVLQYVTHETLKTSLDSRKSRQKKLSVEDVLDWARPLAVTLDELHELDYVHSNVRPEMIYLGQKRQVLLGDFVTEFTVQRLGAFKQAIASLDIADHLAPEYIKSNYNESYDQYLLASIIYEALAERSHFHNPGSTEAYRRQVATKFPESLLTHRPELVGASRVLGKALERNPVKRFDSCREFVNQLGSAKVNPVFANDEDKPVTVIKKVIDETVPADPIITSIRPNRGAGRKKGFVWLGVLLLSFGAGAFAVNHFGGFEQLKTKLTTAWSSLSEDSESPSVIVPISGSLSKAPESEEPASSESVVSEAVKQTEDSGAPDTSAETNTDELNEKPTQVVASQPVDPAEVTPGSSAPAVPSDSSDAASAVSSGASSQPAVAGGAAVNNPTDDTSATASKAADDLAEAQPEIGDEQVVVAESIDSSANVNTDSVVSASEEVTKVDKASLQAAINRSLAEGEAEFVKIQAAINEPLKAAPQEANLNDAISLALREAEVDFMRKTSPASSEEETAPADTANASADTLPSALDATEQQMALVTTPDAELSEPAEASDEIGSNTEENIPLSNSEIESQDLNAQMLEANRLADEQAAAARLEAEEKKRLREAREEAKRRADAEAKKKAEDEARKKAIEAAKLKEQQEKAAEQAAAQNDTASVAEVVSAPADKSFEEMKKERARFQAIKAQKTARINSITKDCVTSGKIHRQVIAGNLAYVKNCLSVGVNPNLTQSNRWTLLHLASLGGYLNMAKLLVAKGATVNAKAADGKTPLDMATEQKQQRLITYLRSRGGVTTR